jgi:pimeloyl-ACP methyl ester carboxylesterase
VFLFGHSAGGQFLSRTAAYGPEALEDVARIVIANPSGHAAPTLDAAPAYGFAGLYQGATADAAPRRRLAMPIKIFLGRRDLCDEDLVTSPTAIRQGRNRLERGRRVFADAKALAERLGWTSSWRKVEFRRVGHSAADMLSAPEAERAFRTLRRAQRDDAGARSRR